VDLDRMLARCRRDQWRADDVDWSRPPPPMSADKEAAIVQAFTDMAAIELLAGALFASQRKRTTDPTLAAIFDSFVVDEQRHSDVAARLARHYDVRRLRRYAVSPALVRFRPRFLRVIDDAAPEVANGYITAGELLLDIALLRSLDDYVGDATSHAAMRLINRDESRHIAIDFHMTEVYASDEFLAEQRTRPKPAVSARIVGLRHLAIMLWHAQPFLREVFLTPMDRTDPDGRRSHEAFKRIQLLARKPSVARLPFFRFMLALQALYVNPRVGRWLGPALLRLIGGEARIARVLFTDDELARSQAMSFDALAEEIATSRPS
jgi:hypothetical protein